MTRFSIRHQKCETYNYPVYVDKNNQSDQIQGFLQYLPIIQYWKSIHSVLHLGSQIWNSLGHCIPDSVGLTLTQALPSEFLIHLWDLDLVTAWSSSNTGVYTQWMMTSLATSSWNRPWPPWSSVLVARYQTFQLTTTCDGLIPVTGANLGFYTKSPWLLHQGSTRVSV